MINKVQKTTLAAEQAHQHRPVGAARTEFHETLEKNRQARSPMNARGDSQPRRSGLEKLTLTHAARLAHFAPLIARHAAKYQVPIELICGVMIQESGANPRARSHCGASGLMQLMPATAKRMGVRNIWDPAQNIEGGVRYLRYLMDTFRGKMPFVIAGYNAGEGAVQKHGGIPPYAETQNYVPRVLSYARTVRDILSGNPQGIRTMIRNTLPRHAIANFTSVERPRAPEPLADATQVARSMARI
ncbi:MAG: lytic transglycosylase domain-containing protein [Deltaproteobacteria bacterium]|nr:lytic transglycosylase domain-containing protein [Deltaproteobacteria bacterium]